jgi:hypothetical protein
MSRNIRDCSVHRQIMDHCVLQLQDCAYFEFSSVLQELRMSAELEIKWHLIRPWIEQDHKIKLLPVVSRFFHQRSVALNKERYRPDINPEKFLCKGTGKKAAGYVLVSKINSAMVLCRLEYQRAAVNGSHRSLDQYETEVMRQGITASPPTPPTMIEPN